MERANPAALLERVLAGDAGALARAITLVENELSGWQALLSSVQSKLGRATIVGFTGPPGVGKSTLVNEFIKEQRRRSRTVGVIAVDPSSPVTGGAVLGDRVRMTDSTLDEGVFIRSLASRGRLGGISTATSRIVDLMDASGREVVVLETVGAGQSEVEVASLADTTVVVCAPGWGDDIQAIKSGILEVADVLVVNKSDDPRALQTLRQLTAMLMLRHGPSAEVAVVSTTATSGQGVGALADAVDRHSQARSRESRSARRLTQMQRFIVEGALQTVKHRCETNVELIGSLGKAVQEAQMDLESASHYLLKSLLGE
jgi:LAO/AO transport system ATPase